MTPEALTQEAWDKLSLKEKWDEVDAYARGLGVISMGIATIDPVDPESHADYVYRTLKHNEIVINLPDEQVWYPDKPHTPD